MTELVRFKGVSKKFCRNLRRSMYYSLVDSLGSFIGVLRGDRNKLRPSEFWALNRVDFQLNQGDILGIVGGNGSGKSTLLRLLTGIYLPEQGTVQVNGRVGALIAVGAGFHPHMTGRENIYLNATILGLTAQEISASFSDIEEFSELEEFLDSPVSTYSSGMKVKLGFAIAVHCSPDILLVDEVLSVGDISFRDKCLKKITELKRKVKGVVFISHNIEQVRSLCNRIIVLDKGTLVFDGSVVEGLSLYQHLMARRSLEKETPREEVVASFNELSDALSIEKASVIDSDRIPQTELTMDQEIRFKLEVFFHEDIENLLINVAIRNMAGINIVWRQIEVGHSGPEKIEAGKRSFLFNFGKLPLEPGPYRIAFGFSNAQNLERYGKFTDIEGLSFVIKGDGISRGIVSSNVEWTFDCD